MKQSLTQLSHHNRPQKLCRHCFKEVSISLLYLYSNNSILDPPLGFLRCLCIAVTCTGRPALSAVWHVILTVPGMAHNVHDTSQLLRGTVRNNETLQCWPKMKKMLLSTEFCFFSPQWAYEFLSNGKYISKATVFFLSQLVFFFVSINFFFNCLK